ncbi:PAS domain-containing protein [Erythrobacter sp. 3-20A1M]|uniref:sensor histidine kinase n=1 Tax=Erythrobacter sp. 3-20A1M TaxID=2653850 RepID=UPI001BFCC7AD|nr:PAS domain-containing sensor histidine kinase [Erythrobacter sp. 3-20A1M]QWC57928.1 PAS domain-containing protein [Erythrobacter sp. 3-20A1M]
MEIAPTALVLIGLLLAAWTVGAAWLMIRAGNRTREAGKSRSAARRMARMLDEAPAIALLVRADSRIEGSDRLARWFGLDRLPDFLGELAPGDDRGLSDDQLAELTENVRRTQKTATPFRMALTVPGSQRSLALRGQLADPQVSPGGAALVWVFDFSESETELSRMRSETARAKGDFAALVGLIEAAPIPMWFRGTNGKLRLVNSAYVDAVGAESADAVVEDQIELVEAVEGQSAVSVALDAAKRNEAVKRTVQATIHGARRALRVSDLPLGEEGIAGYAVDVEEMEERGRAHRAYARAQRSMMDRLSIGVAQFDSDRRLAFANQPFRRTFALSSGAEPIGSSFKRFLSDARDAGRLPEVRDFPAWRAEHEEWFAASEPQEEAWPLVDGTHLRVVAQPMPDGGLALIAEDRTEQLALSATRDTLLRTRTAMVDSLFEALAVFAPDGHLQLWNRSFPTTWGIAPDRLDDHPTADRLLEQIGRGLVRPRQAESIGEVIRSATLDRKERAGRVQMADGRTLEFAGVPLPDGNGLLTTLDVTANEQAETALRERAEALEQADQVKTRFLANMSYEFRTPLTSIGGFAELLESGVAGDMSEQAREYVTAIIDSVARLTEQVENVLDLSQSEAGLLPVSKQSVELQPLVARTVRQREEAITKAGLRLDLLGGARVRVEADPRQLARAIGHLLDNAIAASSHGDRIAIEIGREKGATRISISDRGAGMDEAQLRRAQEGLAPTDEGRMERREGLGIPLSRQLIEAQGGTLQIRSKKGSGTIAEISLT